MRIRSIVTKMRRGERATRKPRPLEDRGAVALTEPLPLVPATVITGTHPTNGLDLQPIEPQINGARMQLRW
jgi:hypothetical protein